LQRSNFTLATSTVLGGLDILKEKGELHGQGEKNQLKRNNDQGLTEQNPQAVQYTQGRNFETKRQKEHF
jgi:hypothetical protein